MAPYHLLVPHPVEFAVDWDKWERQAERWWVPDRSYRDGLEWRDWTYCLTEPPEHPGVINRPRWRHPTYEEACERQRRFNEATREEWESWVGPGSWVNSRRIAKSGHHVGDGVIITDGGQKYAAEQYLAGHARDQQTRFAYGAR